MGLWFCVLITLWLLLIHTPCTKRVAMQQQDTDRSLEAVVLFLCFCLIKHWFGGIKFNIITRFCNLMLEHTGRQMCWHHHRSVCVRDRQLHHSLCSVEVLVGNHHFQTWQCRPRHKWPNSPQTLQQENHHELTDKTKDKPASKIPDKDLKACNRGTISSLAGCTQDCLHLLTNLFCGKSLRSKQDWVWPREVQWDYSRVLFQYMHWNQCFAW